MTQERIVEIKRQILDTATRHDMSFTAGIISECQTALELFLISPKMLSSEYSKVHLSREERDAIIYLQAELKTDERVGRAIGRSVTSTPTT